MGRCTCTCTRVIAVLAIACLAGTGWAPRARWGCHADPDTDTDLDTASSPSNRTRRGIVSSWYVVDKDSAEDEQDDRDYAVGKGSIQVRRDLDKILRTGLLRHKGRDPDEDEDRDQDDSLTAAAVKYASAWTQPVRPPMQKVTLTQIGYIQFLRYVVDVPDLQELSFCVWLRSRNLTHNHPIFSYSKNERRRLARAWVSPARGPRSPPRLHFNILERPVFIEPLPEASHRRWVHICPSWSGLTGHYHLYVDGALRRAGVRHEVAGLSLPPGGDVVVGQEYTDFDKGLDDGVEGDVFGFYLFGTATPRMKPTPASISALPAPGTLGEEGEGGNEGNHETNDFPDHHPHPLQARALLPLPLPLPLLGAHPHAHLLQLPMEAMQTINVDADSSESFSVPMHASYNARPPPPPPRSKRALGLALGPLIRRSHGPTLVSAKKYTVYAPPKNFNRNVPKRVQRLYALCSDRLAEVDRADAIISWTTSPVRVFGGAIISSAHEECGAF